MQTKSPIGIGATLAELRHNDIAGEATEIALDYMSELFGGKIGEGVIMAQRALRLAIPEAQVATLCLSFTGRLVEVARA